MRISIFGSGYVGLVQAAVFSEVGHDVICMDIDRDRIARIQNGDIPFFEPGLGGLLQAGLTQQRLRFTTNSQDAVENSDYLFVCVRKSISNSSRQRITAARVCWRRRALY